MIAALLKNWFTIMGVSFKSTCCPLNFPFNHHHHHHLFAALARTLQSLSFFVLVTIFVEFLSKVTNRFNFKLQLPPTCSIQTILLALFPIQTKQ